VKIGGIKKKFHTMALKNADINTGMISNNMAMIETTNNNINAVT
jgi:hypothetical protein